MQVFPLRRFNVLYTNYLSNDSLALVLTHHQPLTHSCQSHPCWVLLWSVSINDHVRKSSSWSSNWHRMPDVCVSNPVWGGTLGSHGSTPKSKYSLGLEHWGSFSLSAVNKTHLVSGEYKNDGLCYTTTRILHFVYFIHRILFYLPYLMKISNITVCIVVAGTVYCTLVSPLS